jgi:hypothetical protein
LIGVVRRIADDDADLARVLALDSGDVLFRQRAEQVALPAAHPQSGDIVERIDKTQIRVFFIFASQGRVGRLDIQIGDVIRQDRDLVGVQFLAVFVFELGRLAAEMLDQLGDKGAGAGGGVEYFNIPIDQLLAEMVLAQPVGAFDHETHNLARRIDDAEPVSGLSVVDFVEILVDDLEEGLLFVMAGN